MQHLIVTKLAVGNPSGNGLRNGYTHFKHFCAPYIAAQTSTDFLVDFDYHPENPTVVPG
jgi:hypothetical protein